MKKYIVPFAVIGLLIGITCKNTSKLSYPEVSLAFHQGFNFAHGTKSYNFLDTDIMYGFGSSDTAHLLEARSPIYDEGDIPLYEAVPLPENWISSTSNPVEGHVYVLQAWSIGDSTIWNTGIKITYVDSDSICFQYKSGL